jgi:hypothetical protein
MMRLTIMKRLGLASLLLLSACANRRLNPPTLATALSLRGQTYEDVQTRLGPPNDKDTADRAFWFLSEESENHPAPTPILYSFVFSKGRLARVERADDKKPNP